MKTKLRQIVNRTANKTYTYLAIILSKKTMDKLKPTHVVIDFNYGRRHEIYPLLPLKLSVRYDGRGYAVLPREVVAFFKLQKNQELEITLKFKETQR